MHRKTSATLGLMLFTFTMWPFHFLFMKKPTAWPLFALECYSIWPLCMIVVHSSHLLTSPIPIASHINPVSLSSSSNYYVHLFYIYIYTPNFAGLRATGLITNHAGTAESTCSLLEMKSFLLLSDVTNVTWCHKSGYVIAATSEK